MNRGVEIVQPRPVLPIVPIGDRRCPIVIIIVIDLCIQTIELELFLVVSSQVRTFARIVHALLPTTILRTGHGQIGVTVVVVLPTGSTIRGIARPTARRNIHTGVCRTALLFDE